MATIFARLLSAWFSLGPFEETPLGLSLIKWLDGLDEDGRQAGNDLLVHLKTSAGKARPSKKWLKDAAAHVEAVGGDVFVDRLRDWLEAFTPDPERPDPNTDMLKGMIWYAPETGEETLAPVIGRFCETCYRKVPNFGARSIKLGNACLHALGQMGERGVAELVRVRGRMKYAQARQQLEKALNAAAERAGISTDELEEIAMPNFGLGVDGALCETLGEVTAEIRIAGSEDVSLGWTGADGKPRKTVPASVKRDQADALNALRARVKEIKGLLAGQRYRLESLYLKERTWPFPVWRERYLEHPLMANLTRRLIWMVGGTAVIPVGDELIGADGASVGAPSEGNDVSLWHPLDADADTVLAWRRRLAGLEIIQPFKQAHREIYIVTDAELETASYSNRFASHILRQHQFSALCQARGWRYTLQGDWDSHNIPERRIEDRNLTVLFAVDPAGQESLTDMGIYQYVASDRVIFGDCADGTLELADVPPRLFSELMRDVDLFVGVSSIGADPEWVDRGPDSHPALLDYWHSYNTAALTETAKTRRAVLEDLLPKLKIGGVCELEDRYLKVRGKRRGYKIHLGSGNILMEPNDRYLCIVPGSGKNVGGSRIALPFEGDGLLSIILSKAFMLAEDDKITDKTILSQIGA